MNKISLILFLLAVFYSSLFSQVLEGVVYDRGTGKPISQVSVYLNGTSIRTITNSKGESTLGVDKIVNTDLIFSHVSYNMISVPNPFDTDLNKVYLTEKSNLLEEIVILPQQDRKQLLKIFKENFLGTTRGGKSRKILNEDYLRLVYDEENHTLTAFCDTSLIIENKYLEYEVAFNLVKFYIKFKGHYKNSHVENVFLGGMSSFQDLKPNNKKIKKRRVLAYKNSPGNFLKNLANNTLKEGNYRLIDEKGSILPIEENFILGDTLGLKKIKIVPNSTITKIMESIEIVAKVDVLYGKDTWSQIAFLAESISVDEYGNPRVIGDIMFAGSLSEKRLGDMLPLNYEP